MKPNLISLTLFMLCLSPALPAMCQNSNTPATSKPAPKTSRTDTLRDTLETRISSLELKAVDPVTALTQLLKPTKISYDFAREFYKGSSQGALQLPQAEITLRLQNVSIMKALNSLTQTIGIRWQAEEEGGQLTIHFLPIEDRPNGVQPPISDQGGLGGGGLGGFGGGFGGGNPASFALPRISVKLDNRDALVRDSLKSVLQQAKLEFALDEDISPTDKRSFTFENVTLTTALNAICESAGLGWRTEQINNGLLVRVSKRYAPTQP